MLYDLSPLKFKSHSDHFVREVGSIDYLNLFINALSDEKSQELQFIIKLSEEEKLAQEMQGLLSPLASFSKVNEVCAVLKQTFEVLNPKKYTLPILTCLLKSQPPKLKEALFYVREMRSQEGSTKKVAPHLKSAEEEYYKADPEEVSGREALEYICWLAKAEKLY